jgi:hypothetical protein
MTNKELRQHLMSIRWPKGTKVSEAVKIIREVYKYVRAESVQQE